jgi:uncharacterized protein (DUF983 family)
MHAAATLPACYRSSVGAYFAAMATERSIWTGIVRGLKCRCPNCGKGRLFRGFLTPTSRCEVCGNDNTIYPSDDLPPYITVLLVGHIVVGSLLWVNLAVSLPVWLQLLIWLPTTALLGLVLMKPIKGAAIGICWATGIVRDSVPQTSGE